MAKQRLNVTNVQGTKFYLVPTNTDLEDAEKVAIAIATAKQLGCVQTFGQISQSKSVQEYKCMSSNASTKSIGSVSLGNQEISMLFDATSTGGQQELNSMWTNDERRTLIIELKDQVTPTTGNPTYIMYEIELSGLNISLEADAAVLFSVVAEMVSTPEIILAT
ncbi:hypothetical protein [Aliarcobacter lanthieri]|uniref:hypothetical protein n=1 Tax=Aliarcobacter lanthieri TaxID=1355374 RepID=UPI003AAF9C35